MMDIMAGLSAASQAVTIAKALRDVERAYDTVTVKAQVIDLMDKLQDVRGSLQDARDALIEKDGEIARLKAMMVERQATIEKDGYRYRQHPDDATRAVGMPYCRVCETNGVMILCTQSERGRHATCPRCKADFRDGYDQS